MINNAENFGLFVFSFGSLYVLAFIPNMLKVKLTHSEIPCRGHQITKLSAQFQSEAALTHSDLHTLQNMRRRQGV